MSAPSIVDPDVSGLDDLGVVLAVLQKLLRERVRRGRIGLQPLGFEARLEIGAAHRAGELGREPVHDRTRSAFGSEYAEPELRVETSYPGLLERRNLRKRRRPLLPGNRKRPHLAALDVGKRNGEILEGHV